MNTAHHALFIAAISLAAQLAAGAPQWPQFRGPNCAGVADQDKPPVVFGPSTNLLWKTQLPPGASSPCIWGNRIFLTALENGKLETLGIDRASGKILWRQIAPAGRIEETHQAGSPAASTPAADSQRVYSYFGSYGLIAYDFDGKEQWRKPLPVGFVINGTGTSPALLDGRLVVACDQQEGKSFLVAINPQSGQTIWQIPRPEFVSSYTTPVLWERDAVKEIVVVGSVRTVGYDWKDGKERWSVRGTEGISVAPTPVIGDGQLIVMSRAFGGSRIPTAAEFLAQNDKDADQKISWSEAPGYLREHGGFRATDRDKDGSISETEWTTMRDLIGRGEHGIFALRAPKISESGDLTDSHVVWKHKKGVADVSSPLLYRGRVYVVQNGGRLSCYEAKSGNILFEQERLGVDGGYYASPVAANGSIYFASTSGSMAVVQAGDMLQVTARNDLREPISATPAIADNKLYVRSASHLWAFGAK